MQRPTEVGYPSDVAECGLTPAATGTRRSNRGEHPRDPAASRRSRPGKSRRCVPGFSLVRMWPGGETWNMTRIPVVPPITMSGDVRPERGSPRAWKGCGAQRFSAIPAASGWLVGLALALCGAGCAVPSITVEPAALTARPNPSPDGSYAVRWTPIAGASAYRLLEDGALSYEGPSLSRTYVGKAAGSYTYSLTYCVAALGVEICDLRPGLRDLTVTVSSE